MQRIVCAAAAALLSLVVLSGPAFSSTSAEGTSSTAGDTGQTGAVYGDIIDWGGRDVVI